MANKSSPLTNNYARQECIFVSEAGVFDPVLEWAWIDSETGGIGGPIMTPVVAPLVDTNADGKVNEQDVPGVMFIDDKQQLTAVHGSNGSVVFQVTDPTHRVGAGEGFSQIAVGDIDGDHLVEIVTVAVVPETETSTS